MVNAIEILSLVRISDIYSALTGLTPKRHGGLARGAAAWRGGDDLNVSMDDERGVWHDFVTDEGGGVLDLVVRIRGGSHRGALEWVADFAGVELEDRQFPAEDIQKWKEEKALVERYLPLAQLWRRAAVILADETLTRLKTALFDPTLPFPEFGEVYEMEQLLKRLERIDGIELVTEFQWWRDRHPGITEALIAEARKREIAEKRALYRFIKSGVPSGRQSESGH